MLDAKYLLSMPFPSTSILQFIFLFQSLHLSCKSLFPVILKHTWPHLLPFIPYHHSLFFNIIIIRDSHESSIVYQPHRSSVAQHPVSSSGQPSQRHHPGFPVSPSLGAASGWVPTRGWGARETEATVEQLCSRTAELHRTAKL